MPGKVQELPVTESKLLIDEDVQEISEEGEDEEGK